VLLLGLSGLWFCLRAETPLPVLPPAGEVMHAEAPFRFAVVSDTRGNMAVFEEGMACIKEMGVALILHAGDIAERLSERQFDWVLHELDEMDLSVPFCAVPGDHDTDERPPDSQGRYPLYSRAFGPRRYWFACGNALFVAFDDSAVAVTAEDLAWLDGTLSRYRDGYELCFVFFHVPPRTAGIWHTLNEQDSGRLMRLLGRHRVSAAFTGHLHSYAHYEVDGVPVYSTGGLGEGGPPGEPHCFLVCSVKPGGTFSVEKHDIALGPDDDYLEYAFRVKFPGFCALLGGCGLLLVGALREAGGARRRRWRPAMTRLARQGV
jgi:hypothetical protein